jgi:hypothetical protein
MAMMNGGSASGSFGKVLIHGAGGEGTSMMQITFHFRTVGDRKWAFLEEQAVRREMPMQVLLVPHKTGLVGQLIGEPVREIT